MFFYSTYLSGKRLVRGLTIASLLCGGVPHSEARVAAVKDRIAPVVTSFSIPSTSSALQIPITSFTASDNVGVTGFLLTESGTKPGASVAGWKASAPASYTFAAAGSNTLYAWAKDAAGKVSAGKSATVTVTLAVVTPPPPDTTAPVVTAFAMPSSSASLTVPVSAFTANDNIGVTGFRLSESSLAPTASTAGWSASAPTSFSFSAAGSRTVYAWVKDAAGNISASKSAVVTITLPLLGDGIPAAPLLHQSNVAYQGAFRLPRGDFGSPQYTGFSYASTAITYNPGNNSLFVVGHPYHNLVAEVAIPAVVNSNVLTALNTGTMLQNFSDITEGNLKNIGAGGAPYSGSTHVGGLLVFGGRLLGNVYGYYDAAYRAEVSHFSSGLNLSALGDFQGMFTVGSQNPGFVAGYMGLIPAEWQPLFGGPALTGQAGIPVITRTSLGPSASVFNPDDIGRAPSVPATPVLGYTTIHPTLGDWGHTDAANPTGFNMSTQINGIVFPSGSSTVLFFGRQGMGKPCYGIGTSDPVLAQTPDYCYDPVASAKGTHGYPYSMIVWAYNANDLLAVKRGERNMWDILPYDVWFPVLPIGTGNEQIGGVGYDPSRQLIYVSQKVGDTVLHGPLIHVFKVQ